MYSMTGYGRALYSENGLELLVEIKTVNNRNFDLNIKSPRVFLPFEDAVRKTVSEYVLRGRIDLYVSFSDKREANSNVSVDLVKAKGYFDAGEKLTAELGVKNDLTTSVLLRLPDVLGDEIKPDYEDIKEIFIDTVKKACIKLNEMREIEGDKLVLDMLSRMQTIRGLKDSISERAPLVSEEYKEKLKTRIETALSDVNYDETRLLNEVAFFTDKSNIDEELTRLNSHINQFCDIIKTKGCGKKLDFLMQEFNRETNTICSKANDLVITGYALSLKNEIEKVREQVQNLE